MFDSTIFIADAARQPAPKAQRNSFDAVAWEPRPPTRISRARGVKRLGLLYERRVLDVFSAIYGSAFRAAPAIRYRSAEGRWALAIPDGILTLPDWTVIIEVKLRHTDAVWPQLMGRYLPLVRRLVKGAIRPVEVCRSYDPALPLLGPHTVIESLHRPPSCVPGEAVEVLPWRI